MRHVLAIIAALAWWPPVAAQERASAAAAPDASVVTADPTVAIPAGPFWMGCNEAIDHECADDEKPGREVDVAAFRIDRTEVTAARYRRCVDAEACAPAPIASECTASSRDTDNHPVNCLTWEEARTFCVWADGRLPTEAEWEKAARGDDRRKFPWGNHEIPAAGQVANICDVSCSLKWRLESYDDGHAETAPVGEFPAGASPFGVLDMGGNVWEWTADAYMDTPSRVIRGGSWNNQARNTRTSIRTSFRPDARAATVGFRCVY